MRRVRLERSSGGPPLYVQVAREVERLALDAPLGDEAALPPEWSLVERFGVSRGTIRRAIGELERRGLLWREPGRGTFVNPAARLRRVVWTRLAEVAKPDSRFDFDFSQFVPDFEGSERCDRRIRRTEAYRRARTLFVTPDNNLEGFRRAALADGKRLVVSTYGMRRGFVLLDPARVPAEDRPLAATLDGMERFAPPLTLAELRRVGRVDAVVTGAAAVSAEGVHFGKGHGYLDMEWGLLRELGLVGEGTPVFASVHECQVVWERVPHAPYDCTVDVIVTPERLIVCDPVLPKPPGLFWERIPAEVMALPYFGELARELQVAS